MTILPADAICQVAARLFDSVTLDLPNPLVWANYAAQCDPARRRSLLSRNAPRRAHLPALNLLRYPRGTLVNGDRSYLTVANDAIVQAQRAPWCADPEDEAQRMRDGPSVEISVPTLLLARFGENTWGHWVGEMLAKAAIAERLSPGRFFHAVPWWTTEPGTPYADAVLQSLAAYGIPPDRLIRLCGFQVYRFDALHDISGDFAEGLHPGALESLTRPDLAAAGPPTPPKIAMLRRPPLARALFNANDIAETLTQYGFHLATLERLSFLDQIRLFAQAECIAGSLGSDFWAVPFAPTGLSLVTLAPAAWEDGYFIRLFQRAAARHADIRGPSTLLDEADPVCSPHLIDPALIAPALETALAPATHETTIDGEPTPRRLGREILHLDFRAAGNAEPWLEGDWSPPEPTHRWSLGSTTRLVIPPSLLPPGTGYWLEIGGQGHVYPPHLSTRPLTVIANGVEMGNFDLIGRTRLFCRLPPITAPLTLTFHHPICPSPRQMGAGPDDRPLGFGFESLRVHSLPP